MWRSPEARRRARWIVERDLRMAIACQRALARPAMLLAMAATSRLSDGPLWCLAMVALPFVGGAPGVLCAMQMASAGGINLAVYLMLKRGIGRERPYVHCTDIRACARALDQFSFPSGHTLHAVSFGLLLAHHYPVLGLPLALFALLVAASRMVLGLHFPSDVLAGAALGTLTATGVLALWP